jgi:signal transduction histidine kinase
VRDEEVVRGELHSPGNSRWYYIVNTRIHNQDGGISMMVMLQDITEKKSNEMRLIMSEKLAALGQMASGIAHEINNPLATISACAEGLMGRIKKERLDPEVFENYLKIISEEVSRCKVITTNMLSFIRKTGDDKKEIDINEMLDKTLDMIRYQGRLKQVEVVKKYSGKLFVNANEGELRQVFLSIIVNALDAMEDRGAITLETGREDHRIFIRISDTGPGIPPELLHRIFDPFFTTRSESGGTGLGLSIAKKIIDDSRGTIDVASKPGQGVSFRIVLPV